MLVFWPARSSLCLLEGTNCPFAGRHFPEIAYYIKKMGVVETKENTKEPNLCLYKLMRVHVPTMWGRGILLVCVMN